MTFADPFTVLAHALNGRAPVAPLLAFAAGLSTSVSPCATTRIAALGGLTTGAPRSRKKRLAVAFIVGLMTSAAALVSSASLWRSIAVASATAYWFLACALTWFGLRALLDDVVDCNATQPTDGKTATEAWAFLNGASFGLVASPCCTPVLASVAALASTGATRWQDIATGLAFSVGHIAVLIPAAIGVNRFEQLRSHRWYSCASMVNGSVLVSLGAYYALLA